jgi:hypothetical protein
MDFKGYSFGYEWISLLDMKRIPIGYERITLTYP